MASASFFLLAALLVLPSSAAPAAPCGNATLPLESTKKNVLLVGDSISMSPPYTPGGYGHILEQLLSAQGVFVQHAGGDFSGGQCADTRTGLKCTNLTGPGMLDVEGTFDLIHFNYGLHDLANYSAALPPLPLPQYGENLATIYQRFAAKSRMVMWTTTTPCPNVPTSFGRSWQLVVDYNKQALASLTAVAPGGKLLVDDLWQAMVSACGDHYTNCKYQLPANVHLTPAGEELLAAAASREILRALGL